MNVIPANLSNAKNAAILKSNINSLTNQLLTWKSKYNHANCRIGGFVRANNKLREELDWTRNLNEALIIDHKAIAKRYTTAAIDVSLCKETITHLKEQVEEKDSYITSIHKRLWLLALSNIVFASVAAVSVLG